MYFLAILDYTKRANIKSTRPDPLFLHRHATGYIYFVIGGDGRGGGEWWCMALYSLSRLVVYYCFYSPDI